MTNLIDLSDAIGRFVIEGVTNLIDLVDLSHLERFRSSDESIPAIDLV